MTKKSYNIILLGTEDFCTPYLTKLIASKRFDVKALVTQPDKPFGRKQEILFSSLKKTALDNSIDVYQPADINDVESIKKLKSLTPDIILVINFGQILSPSFLKLAMGNIFNIHYSLLPKYRGATPIQSAILNGDSKTGFTIFKIDEKLDQGPILYQQALSIDSNDTTASLVKKMANISHKNMNSVLLKILEKKLVEKPQDESSASYSKTLKREDGKINWGSSADTINNMIRAYDPWPGTYTIFDNKRLKIYTVEKIASPKNLTNGQTFKTDDGYLGIACQDEALKLIKLQLEGKNKTTSNNLTLGYPNIINSILD